MKKMNWKDRITLIQPCVEDSNLVMGEVLLNPAKNLYKTKDFIKIRELCFVVRNTEKDFKNIKCSEEVGVVTFTFLAKKVIITKVGRITIQRAKSKNDLMELFQTIIDLLNSHNLILKDNENLEVYHK